MKLMCTYYTSKLLTLWKFNCSWIYNFIWYDYVPKNTLKANHHCHVFYVNLLRIHFNTELYWLVNMNTAGYDLLNTIITQNNLQLCCCLSITKALFTLHYNAAALLIYCFLPHINAMHLAFTSLSCVHSPLQLRCSKLQCPKCRLCADYCIAVLQQS